MMNPNDLFTQTAAALEVGVEPPAVAMRISRGLLRPVKIHGAQLVSRAEILRWKKERVERGKRLTGER